MTFDCCYLAALQGGSARHSLRAGISRLWALAYAVLVRRWLSRTVTQLHAALLTGPAFGIGGIANRTIRGDLRRFVDANFYVPSGGEKTQARRA